MNALKYFLACTVALAIVGVTLAGTIASAGQDHAREVDVLSVKVDARGLIVIVCRDVGEVMFADGTHQGREAGVVFKRGTIVSVTGGDSYGVEEVSIGDNGEIILISPKTAADAASTHLLPDGSYRLQRGTSDDDDVSKKSRATGFRVRAGKIVSAVVDWLAPIQKQ